MALLTPEDLAHMTEALVENDRLIQELTQNSLDALCREIYQTAPKNETIAVIPITAGNGIIGSFSESLLFTVKHFGMNGFITEKTDVAGFYEAVIKGADIILMADDLAYIAYHLKNGKIAHNQICTGRIYAEIICHAEAYADDCDVLVLGLGHVGTPAVETFLKEKQNVYVFDVNEQRTDEIVSQYPVLKYDPAKASRSFSKIFEATPCPDTIHEAMLKENALVSTPGIPLGISEELIEQYRVRVVQEPLGIGTLSMLYAVFDDI